ncbi:MAG: heme A synthase [Flavobacteriales bacterium]|nr:heme A synthase [Flavobacteriales bacterium]|tara:strand:+ start:582 stop:1592 length:1011 start_codon:yes stop_codon:yes gene_type:complete
MKENKAVILWLISGCLLILLMVIIGGVTRLTHSGLSMVNWSLFMGAIPPLNEVQWQETFELYKQSPEFKKINFSYTLSDFKYIFFWEYLHRLMGRVLGLVFIIPFIYFLIKKKLSKKLILQSTVLFCLGALQGAIGWWMVKSGLVERPDVSHYRLAVHLTTAFLTCSFTFWVALPLIITDKLKGNRTFFKYTTILFFLVLIQIIYGAFVAGLNAGIGFNTWPKMNGEWIPQAVYYLDPLWKNFIEAPYGVQFVHRILAVVIVSFVGFMWFKGKKIKLENNQISSLNIIISLVMFQAVLGILTLLLKVPISLALAHQLGAFFLLMSVVYSLFIFKKS